VLNGSGSGQFYHVDWNIRYNVEAAKHLDVSALRLTGYPNLEDAVLQSSSTKPGDGGFTATWLFQDGDKDATISIDAEPDRDYNGTPMFVYEYTVTNNNPNNYFGLSIYSVTGFTVLEHEVEHKGVEVYFDFGGEDFGELDDFELEAGVSPIDLGFEEGWLNTIAGTIAGARRSNQTVITFYAEGQDWGVFNPWFPPIVVPTAWDGNVATLSFFDPNMNGEEIWDMVKSIADNMAISVAIKNEAEAAA
jgi:hypothetical protein